MVYCLGNQCDMLNKIAFSSLVTVRSSSKVCCSSNGHLPDVSIHLRGSLGSSYHPDNGFPSWKWSKAHSQFSISHANEGEQWCK